MKSLYQKDTCTVMFVKALFIIVKIKNQDRCLSTDEWIKKIWYVYMMDNYSTIKKEWNSILCSHMDWTEGHYVKQNNPDTENRYHISSLICGN
jgi:hypothetical protein